MTALLMPRLVALARQLRGAALLLLIWGLPAAWAQVSHVSSSVGTLAGNAVSSVQITRPSGLAAGDVMVALLAQRGSNFPIISSPPSGWTLLLNRANGSSIGMAVYFRVATGSEPGSWTWSFGASDRAVGAISAYRGVDTSAPLSSSGSQANASSVSMTAPTVSPTTANSMLIALYAGQQGGNTMTAPPGMTEAYDAATGAGPNGIMAGSAYAVQAATSASGPKVATASTAAVNLGALVVLQPATVTPLAYWRMDEAQWNGAANEVVDSSGNGHHGRAMRAAGSTALPSASVGVPAYTSGTQSTCNFGQFDSSAGTVRSHGYVELPSFPSLSSSFSVAAWVRSDNVANAGQRILVRDDADNGWAMSLGDGGSGRLRLFNRNISNSGAVSGNGVNPACGVFCLDTTAVIASGNWYFVAAAVDTVARTVTLSVFSSSGALLASTSSAFSGTWQPGTGLTAIGGETTASSEGRNAAFHFKGRIDEVQVHAQALTQTQVQGLLANVRTCPASGPDHYELSLPAASLACVPTTVTITACANSSSPCTSPASTVNGATATLTTSGASLGATTLTFNSSGVATTTLSYPTATQGATASVTVSGESTAATNPRQCCPNGSGCAAANSCSTTFNTAGFVVSASANGAAATLPTQTAGTASSTYYLRAVQSGTGTQACVAALTGAASVNWAYQCNNPGTCFGANLMSLNGGATTTIQRNNNAGVATYASVPMSFDANGSAPFTFTFNDVGQTTLWASKGAAGSLLSALAGSSNAFVVRPAGFTVTGVTQTASPNLANPAAASAAGARFVRAGESFSASVTAVTSGGVATPNFGKETVPEGVLLTRALALPSGGAAGTLSNGTVAGASFSSGAATVNNLAFSEVGIITLTPGVADADYLGAGNVTGTATGNIGRFVPAQFAVSASTVTHRAALSCNPASAFSYLGENFRLGFTLTAQNSAGTTTQNYSGGFAKLDPTVATGWNLAGRDAATVFTPASGRLSLGSASGSWSNGVASTVTLMANAARAATPDGPFNASFGIAPVDSDGVAVAAANMASASGGSNDRASLGVLALHFGRLRLVNAVGAQTRALALPVTAQSWTGAAFDTHALDSCTSVPATAVSFGNLRRTLTVADTAVAGSSVALAAGLGRLTLSAPLNGRYGSADVTLSLGSSAADASCLQPWTPGAGDAATAGANLAFLRGAWCASSHDKDPSARATWGLYRGADAVLYQRENY